MSLTPALTTHVEEKIGDALMRISYQPATKVNIELTALEHTHDGRDKVCRVTVRMPKAKPIVIYEADDDMYKAINVAHDRVLNRVKRERGRSLRQSGRRKFAKVARATTARRMLGTQPERWEQELAEFEGSTARQ